MRKFFTDILLPSTLLSGAIIGAGIFALPFAFAQAGLLTGALYLFVFGVIFSVVHLLYADVIARTDGDHRLMGYATLYLGRAGHWFTLVTTVFGMVLVLTAYLILSMSFTHLLFPQLSSMTALLLFWFVGSLPLFFGMRRLAAGEFVSTWGIALIILVIFWFGFTHVDRLATYPSFSFAQLFLPYGLVLFALAGRVAVPLVMDYFKNRHMPARAAFLPIVLGTFVPAVLYFLFVLGVLTISSPSQDTISGIVAAGFFSEPILVFLGALGLIALWSSYILVGWDIHKSLLYDVRFSEFFAVLFVVFFPLLLYFVGLNQFLPLIGLAGGVFVALEAILIGALWLRAFRAHPGPALFSRLHPALVYLILAVFAGGIIYELFYFFL